MIDALGAVPSDFDALMQDVPSIDPLTTWDMLNRLAEEGDGRAVRMLDNQRITPQTVSTVPIPHPLEYDWRFTPETASALVARLANLTVPADTIGYFGVPTAYALGIHQLPDRRHVLFDRSVRRLMQPTAPNQIVGIDLLRDDLPAIELSAALADPPWYPEHVDAFLWAAASLLRVGGSVIASFPPEATRPGISEERETIRQNAVRAGLIVVNEERLSLRYRTPPFETAAYRAAGVPHVPDSWRRGDMLTLLKDCSSSAARPILQSAEDGWEVVELQELPLGINPSGKPALATDALLEPAVDGATLPSVSRRHPARADACLWSSRNRIFRSAHPPLLAALVHALSAGTDMQTAGAKLLGRDPTSSEQEKMHTAANQIAELVAIERQEHGLEGTRP